MKVDRGPELRNNPRIGWNALHRASYQPGSIASEYWPDLLEDKRRAPDVFSMPVYTGKSSDLQHRLDQDLKPAGVITTPVVTVETILPMTEEDLIAKIGRDRARTVRQIATASLRDAALSPHAHLVGDVLGIPQDPIPANEDERVMDHIDNIFDLIPQPTGIHSQWDRDRAIQITRAFYGFDDHRPLSFKEVGELFNIASTRADYVVNKLVLDRLRAPHIRRYLSQYRSTSVDSLARQGMGIALDQEVGHIAGTVEELGLPLDELPETMGIRPDMTLNEFITSSFPRNGRPTPEQYELLVGHLNAFFRQHPERRIFGELLPNVTITRHYGEEATITDAVRAAEAEQMDRNSLRVIGSVLGEDTLDPDTWLWLETNGVTTIDEAIRTIVDSEEKSPGEHGFMPGPVRKDVVALLRQLVRTGAYIEDDTRKA